MYFSNVYVSQGISVVKTEKYDMVDSTAMNFKLGEFLTYLQNCTDLPEGLNSVRENKIEVFLTIWL